MKRRIIQKANFIDLLAIPYPYKAWLCISNDPDNTTIENWNELHNYIWKELQLPFGDALFLKSFNNNLPGQVNFADHSHILQAHFHDSLHFWGDYQHSRQRAFDRTDAEEAEKTLVQNNFKPKVWVDHSNHRGNFIHSSFEGALPYFKDSSGVEYKNFNYSLDIAERVGIKYVWDGDITSYIGQDVPVSYYSYLINTETSFIKAVSYTILKFLLKNSRFKKLIPQLANNNLQVCLRSFPDGRKFYCFIRYGTWADADIDGLAKIISPSRIEQLLNRQGTCIVYTHLGKRKPNRNNHTNHIPVATKAAFSNLREQYQQKNLMLSPISTMLDYLIIRNNVSIDSKIPCINFISDGVRFQKLTFEDLTAHSFSFILRAKSDPSKFKILMDGNDVKHQITDHGNNIYSIVFT